MLEFYSYEGAAGHPQRTEPCQRVSGQPWAYHEPLQGQMKHLQYAKDFLEPSVGAKDS